MGLLEVGTCLRDFEKRKITEEERKSFFGNTAVTGEYLGYIDKKIKVRYGIDLKKLQIHSDGSKVVVSGIKCEYQGTMSRSIVSEHYEIREKVTSVRKSDDDNVVTYSHGIDPDNKGNLRHEAYKAQIKKIEDKLNSGVDLAGLEGASAFVEARGKGIIKNIFLQARIPVEFTDYDIDGGQTLEEFAKKRNERIADETRKTRDELKQLTAS